MTEQKFICVDVNYLKELEEKAKKVDYYKGIIDGINMCRADRAEQTESQNWTDWCKECGKKDRCVRAGFMPQCYESEDEPQTDCGWK